MLSAQMVIAIMCLGKAADFVAAAVEKDRDKWSPLSLGLAAKVFRGLAVVMQCCLAR